MKVKFYILGILAALCLVGTVVYVRALHEEHDQKVAEWKESAKTAFEEALWMEVDKRSEIPVYRVLNGEKGVATLNRRIPDSVFITLESGRKGYKIERSRYENSLMKESLDRSFISALLKIHPLSVDTLLMDLDSLLMEKQIPLQAQVRYVYTNENLDNDTLFSPIDKRISCLDSLTVKYLGFRCEHELMAFVASPHWLSGGAWKYLVILSFPWLLLVWLIVCYSRLEKWVQRKFVREKVKVVVQEKTVEKEKEIYITNVQIGKVGVFKLPDGTLLDTQEKKLCNGEKQHNIKPQSISLLTLFLSKNDYKITIEEISWELWKKEREKHNLYSAMQRLRADLKAVNSDLVIDCFNGVYELKLPISSNDL